MNVMRLRPLVWLRAHPGLADAAIAVGVALATLLMLFAGRDEPGTRDYDALAVVLTLGAAAALPWRRRAPVPVLAVSTAFFMAMASLDYPDSPGPPVFVALYSLGAYAEPPAARRAFAVFVVAIGLLFTAGFIVEDTEVTVGSLVASNVVFVTAYVFGGLIRQRRQRVVDLEERAQRLEREQELLAARAVTEERARIARELHDVVAHSLSVMVVQAGAARRIARRSPEQAEQALATVETTGREALSEMRRLLGVLRTPTTDPQGGERAPQPSLACLGELVDTDPELPVRLRVEGDWRGLPPTVDLSAYRIVQEALTNVRQHAGPATADVVVRIAPDAVRIEVDDDGRGAAANGHGGPGHGLVGMRERAALLGGEVEAGPRPGGGWRVRARLPLPDGA